MRPPRPDIAVPPMPEGLEWIGRPMKSVERLVAARPALVHFFDVAQLNSVRVLPYLRAWHERYERDGLALVGIHSPRFPFTQSGDVVAGAAEHLGISWSIALDPLFSVWRMYEPHGWPALFLWGRGGALRWYHLGEGEYAGTEEAIREALAEAGTQRDWPATVEPLRPSDAPGTEVIAPTPEHFPGGSTEEPWSPSVATPSIELSYEAGGAYAAVDGTGEIAVRLDDAEREPVRVSQPGLVELTVHERTQRHRLELSPSPELSVYSIQFAAAPPG